MSKKEIIELFKQIKDTEFFIETICEYGKELKNHSIPKTEWSEELNEKRDEQYRKLDKLGINYEGKGYITLTLSPKKFKALSDLVLSNIKIKKSDVIFNFKGGNITFQDLFGKEPIVLKQVANRLNLFFEKNNAKAKRIMKAESEMKS